MTQEQWEEANRIDEAMSTLRQDLEKLEIAKDRSCTIRIIADNSNYSSLKLTKTERDAIATLLIEKKNKKLKELEEKFKNL